jgi:hypothetical protein
METYLRSLWDVCSHSRIDLYVLLFNVGYKQSNVNGVRSHLYSVILSPNPLGLYRGLGTYRTQMSSLSAVSDRSGVWEATDPTGPEIRQCEAVIVGHLTHCWFRSQQTHHYTKQVRVMATLCQLHSDKRRDCFHCAAFPDLVSDNRLEWSDYNSVLQYFMDYASIAVGFTEGYRRKLFLVSEYLKTTKYNWIHGKDAPLVSNSDNRLFYVESHPLKWWCHLPSSVFEWRNYVGFERDEYVNNFFACVALEWPWVSRWHMGSTTARPQRGPQDLRRNAIRLTRGLPPHLGLQSGGPTDGSCPRAAATHSGQESQEKIAMNKTLKTLKKIINLLSLRPKSPALKWMHVAGMAPAHGSSASKLTFGARFRLKDRLVFGLDHFLCKGHASSKEL